MSVLYIYSLERIPILQPCDIGIRSAISTGCRKGQKIPIFYVAEKTLLQTTVSGRDAAADAL